MLFRSLLLNVAVCAKRADWPFPAKPLWALNWSAWGVNAGQPELGDILTFVRPGGGHVGLYVGEDFDTSKGAADGYYHVLGFNQGDAVSIIRLDKERMRAARRPQWKTAEPPNRRRIILAPTGVISHNEA